MVTDFGITYKGVSGLGKRKSSLNIREKENDGDLLWPDAVNTLEAFKFTLTPFSLLNSLRWYARNTLANIMMTILYLNAKGGGEHPLDHLSVVY